MSPRPRKKVDRRRGPQTMQARRSHRAHRLVRELVALSVADVVERFHGPNNLRYRWALAYLALMPVRAQVTR